MASAVGTVDNAHLEENQGQSRNYGVEMSTLMPSTAAIWAPSSTTAAAQSGHTLPTSAASHSPTTMPLTAVPEAVRHPDTGNSIARDTPLDVSSSTAAPATTTSAMQTVNIAPVQQSPETIGSLPSHSDPSPAQPQEDTANPVCLITLLLTTGARHPYKLDEKYLEKRNVPIPDVTASGKKDPFSISVYTLKELILREWREDWDMKPSSPSSIRLIHFGKLLDDKEALRGTFTPRPSCYHLRRS